MPVLIVEHEGTRRVAQLPRRVLIGRRSMNHLIVDHPSVARMHAWIDAVDDRFYITDMGSRTGTLLNGQRLVTRHLLGDEDEITIGPARLIYLSDEHAPADLELLDLSATPAVDGDEEGVLFQCECGAPLWASPQFYGSPAQCRYCGKDLVIPRAPVLRSAPLIPQADPENEPEPEVEAETEVAPEAEILQVPQSITTAAVAQRVAEAGNDDGASDSSITATLDAPAPTMPQTRRTEDGELVCGVCQSAISVFEDTTTCPSCGLFFHAECWVENYGCSAYGCPQVNALKPIEEPQSANGDALTVAADEALLNDDAKPPFPWEFVLLAASVFSMLLGAVSFGLPALISGIVASVYLSRHRNEPRSRIVVISIVLAVVGLVLGIAVSYYLFMGGAVRSKLSR
jgi:hypothetical protein